MFCVPYAFLATDRQHQCIKPRIYERCLIVWYVVCTSDVKPASVTFFVNTNCLSLLSRRSRHRERLSASMLSICLFVSLLVCLSACLSPKCNKMRFSQKLSNLELWCLLTTYRKLCNWAFQRTHYRIPKIQDKIQDGWNPPSWKSIYRHFFLPRVIRFG